MSGKRTVVQIFKTNVNDTRAMPLKASSIKCQNTMVEFAIVFEDSSVAAPAYDNFR